MSTSGRGSQGMPSEKSKETPTYKSHMQALSGPELSGQEFQVSGALAWVPWSQRFLAL